MALLNRAYDRVQDAPLRFHPISRGTETVFDDHDAAVEASIRRARSGRIYRQVTVGIAFAVIGGLALGMLIALFLAMGASRRIAVLLATAFVAVAFPLRRSFDPLTAAWALRDVLRFLVR